MHGHFSFACLLALLAAPDLCAQKLKVYVLAGQSNMEGHAKVETFDHLADDKATAPLLARMRDKDGKPVVRNDVWISYLTGDRVEPREGHGPLTAGFGARNDPTKSGGKIGPEFTFGIAMGDAHGEPVLLVKCAWGGTSLHTDWRPPSAGPFTFDPRVLARWEKEGKDVEAQRAEKVAATGRCYRATIEHVKAVLADPKRVCPAYDPARGWELAGFVWFQGWNDMVDSSVYPDRDKEGGYAQYSECLAHLIRDVRKDLDAPALPFVIGVMGVGGPIEPGDRGNKTQANFRAAMRAPAALPEFRDTVRTVETAPFWDLELGAIADKQEQVRQYAHLLRSKNPKHENAKGDLTEEQQKALVERRRKELISAAEETMFARGASNGGYHYLGCAKTFARMGVAFADALQSLGR